MNVPPVLVGLGVMAAGIVVAAILFTLDFALLGIVLALAAIPLGLVAWVVANDR